MNYEKIIAQYDLVVSKVKDVERKGKTSPYTSVNGNMFSMIRKDGTLGIRLSKDDQEEFMKNHKSEPFENYGSMIKDYVEVPESVLMDTDLMVEYLNKSFEYTKTLKAKPTKKSKPKEKKEPKKVTHDVGTTYKNGQIKAEIVGDELIFYFEDGSIKAKGKILNEKMEGKWIFNRKGGQLWQVGNFTQDVKDGEIIRYDSKDQVAYHVIFKNGKVIEKIV